MTFAAGFATASKLVSVLNDLQFEGTETVALTLGVGAGYAVGSPSTANITIQDDDPPDTFQFSPSFYTVDENGGSVTLSVTRTGFTLGAASVQYATANGSAIASGDFIASSGTLNWLTGDTTSKSFTVPIVNDGLAEPPEQFLVNLLNPTGGVVGSGNTATVALVDNDLAGTLQFS